MVADARFVKPIGQGLLKDPFHTLIQQASKEDENSVQDVFCVAHSHNSGAQRATPCPKLSITLQRYKLFANFTVTVITLRPEQYI